MRGQKPERRAYKLECRAERLNIPEIDAEQLYSIHESDAYDL